MHQLPHEFADHGSPDFRVCARFQGATRSADDNRRPNGFCGVPIGLKHSQSEQVTRPREPANVAAPIFCHLEAAHQAANDFEYPRRWFALQKEALIGFKPSGRSAYPPRTERKVSLANR
jgi:uncharacterized caspase-like protein